MMSIVNDLLNISGLGPAAVQLVHTIGNKNITLQAEITKNKRVNRVDVLSREYQAVLQLDYPSFKYNIIPGTLTVRVMLLSERALSNNRERLTNTIKHDIDIVTQLIDDTVENTLDVLLMAIDLKDKHTAEHSQGVANLARDFTQWLQQTDAGHFLQLYDKQWGPAIQNNRLPEVFYIAGLLHDIGKLGIPEYILDKPGTLNKDEFRVIKMHPVYSQNIVARNPIFSELAEVVGSHHENWNGTGYPNGIMGLDIPLGGRVLAIVDRFDAIMRPRIYKRAANVENALHILNLDIETFGKSDIVLDPYIGIEFLMYIMLDSPLFAKQRATLGEDIKTIKATLLSKRESLLHM